MDPEQAGGVPAAHIFEEGLVEPADSNPAGRFGVDEATWGRLARRLGRVHLRQRLGIERDFEARVFGQGLNFFHIENWYSVHGVIRGALRVLGLHRRGRRNARAVRVRRNEIAVSGLAPPFDGYTILHITDPHLDMSEDISAALARAVGGLEYDLCVITGDFRARTYGAFDAALEAARGVRAHLNGPALGVLGNHDTICMVPGLEGLGIDLLLNESTVVERGGARLYIAGVDDPHYYQADNLERAAADIPEGAPALLLAHSPEIYRHAAHAGFDVMLCGHTHGGQICLPGGLPLMRNARCPRALCAGPWRYHALQGYTSVGSGACVVDVRLNCPPEVVLHRLRAA
ncbi:MAG: metallophosphoesterase [Gammaproteobacteria bacterium]|nr:metallophosphoesterase [Gammaproteobacteria bacterium]NIR98154.1 metallophosphoesterase [Gammaproteobacteria bacterium]NIT62541.1 metallophosphoesterase [Gammaproteobacteria bacterium]NIV20798.1 metallophosphoesterase [Gammaproteobacteria bacterium]NIY31121.1 metallophosphoesterase [Gammaproteobacteria bacterium]